MNSPPPADASEPGRHRRDVSPGFGTSLVTLVSGTAAAQLVGVALVPLIAWAYSPAAFGAFTSVWLLASSLGTLATLRYERAIPLMRSETLALAVERLAWRSVFIIVGTSGAGLVLAFAAKLVPPAMPLLTLLFGLMLASLFAAYLILAQRLVRKERFRCLAIGEFIGVAGIGLFQIASALTVGSGVESLLGGAVAGRVAQVSYLVLSDRSASDRSQMARARAARSRRVRLLPLARLHYRFPLYSAPYSQLAVVLSRALVLLAALYLPPAVVGFIALAHRLTYMPVTTVANALRRVTVRQMSERTDGVAFESRTVALFGLVSIAALPYVLGAGVVLPWLLVHALPVEWYGATPYVVALVPAAAGLLVSSWFDRIYEIRSRQRLALLLELGSSIAILTLYWFALERASDPVTAVHVFAVGVLFYNLVWTCISWRVAGFSLVNVARELSLTWFTVFGFGGTVIVVQTRTDTTSNLGLLIAVGVISVAVVVSLYRRLNWRRRAFGISMARRVDTELIQAKNTQ